MQLTEVYCPNRGCKNYRKKGVKNISVIDRYGKSRYRLLRCRTCGFRFSERRWTIFFGLHTEESVIKETLVSLLRGKSIRKTADEMGIDKDTVQRIWKRVVKSWEKILEDFLEDLDLQSADFENLIPFGHVNLQRPGINRKRKKSGIYRLPARVEI